MAAPQSPEGAGQVCAAVLDTLECFLDTCPALTGAEIKFGPRVAFDGPDTRRMLVEIEGETYYVTVRRGKA